MSSVSIHALTPHDCVHIIHHIQIYIYMQIPPMFAGYPSIHTNIHWDQSAVHVRVGNNRQPSNTHIRGIVLLLNLPQSPTLLGWGRWLCEKGFPAPLAMLPNPVLFHLSGQSGSIVLEPFDVTQVCHQCQICSRFQQIWKMILEMAFSAHYTLTECQKHSYFMYLVRTPKFIAPHELCLTEGGWSWHPFISLLKMCTVT